jgi:hypothetical protein
MCLIACFKNSVPSLLLAGFLALFLQVGERNRQGPSGTKLADWEKYWVIRQ